MHRKGNDMASEGLGSSQTHDDLTRRMSTQSDESGDRSSDVKAAADQVKEQAAQVTDQVKDQAGKVTDKAKEQATTRAEEQKERAAQGLLGFADSLNQVSGSMRDQNPTMANFADTAATRLEDFATSIRDKDVNELMSDVEDMARRQPALFIGGAFLAGVVAARFLKSSSGMTRSGYSQNYSSDRYSRNADAREYTPQYGSSSYQSTSGSSSNRLHSSTSRSTSGYGGTSDSYEQSRGDQSESDRSGASYSTAGTYRNQDAPGATRTGSGVTDNPVRDTDLTRSSSDRHPYSRFSATESTGTIGSAGDTDNNRNRLPGGSSSSTS